MEISQKTIEFAGVAFEVCGPPADPYFFSLQQHMRENALHAAALNTMPSDAVILDIGANIGATVALAAALLPQSTFVAVEPSEVARACLARTIQANKLQDRVKVVASCVGREVGVTQFAEAAGSLASSSVWQGPTGGVSVAMTTLDALTQGMSRLDFLKIDVEGWELDVLQGGMASMKRLRPLVLAELNSWAFIALRNLSPRMLVDYVLDNFGPIALLGDGKLEVARTPDDRHTLLYRNIMQRQCIDDIVFSADSGKVERLAA